MRAFRNVGAVLLSCAALAQATAGNAIGELTVSVRFVGICIGVSQSQAARAEVRVTCHGLDFVSIEAYPDQAFVGTHGGAYRYAFSGWSAPVMSAGSGTEMQNIVGAGTVTAFRAMDVSDSNDQPEFLITF